MRKIGVRRSALRALRAVVRPVSGVVGACALAVAMLGVMLGVMPAHAATQSLQQQIVVPTFGTPAFARLAYLQTGQNGVLGYVFHLEARTTRFTLAPASGDSNTEDFDIFFYSALDSTTGAPLQPAYASVGAESGLIPVGAQWAIVTLSAGAQGTFRYTAS